ncbi:MAG: thiamine phosphate synthase [Dehalococcoidia bacterium]|nr:thiamine phosphate synthase [Dehalococcoidia bacterium]MDD5493071.1 thiamine phosphate synthase [Dehalococcoidia bacterium]
MHPRILRIIDANINRVSEGLRTLEDVARFVIEDPDTSRQLKSIRHKINHLIHKLDPELVFSRQAESDIGADFDITTEHATLPLMVKANAKRVEEGLRVMEELAKLPELKPLRISTSIKSVRYSVYVLEKTISARLLRQDVLERFKGLHILINLNNVEIDNLTPLISEIMGCGISAVELAGQPRTMKNPAMLRLLNDIKGLCSARTTLLVLHDHLDLALACHPDCFCMRDSSISAQLLRQRFPFHTLIGCRAATALQVKNAVRSGVDFIFMERTVRDNQAIAEKASIRHFKSMISQNSSLLPIVVKMGTASNNISTFLSAGAIAVTIDSTALPGDNISKEIKRMVSKIEKEGRTVH